MLVQVSGDMEEAPTVKRLCVYDATAAKILCEINVFSDSGGTPTPLWTQKTQTDLFRFILKLLYIRSFCRITTTCKNRRALENNAPSSIHWWCLEFPASNQKPNTVCTNIPFIQHLYGYCVTRHLR